MVVCKVISKGFEYFFMRVGFICVFFVSAFKFSRSNQLAADSNAM